MISLIKQIIFPYPDYNFLLYAQNSRRDHRRSASFRHQFAYGLISAAIPGTHMGIEGNDCLSAEIILVKTSGEDATHMRNTFPCLELSICFQF